MTPMYCSICSDALTHPWERERGLCLTCSFDLDNQRERDDFADLDDLDSEPLPASDWYDLDLATQDMLTSRQQTEMAGAR